MLFVQQEQIVLVDRNSGTHLKDFTEKYWNLDCVAWGGTGLSLLIHSIFLHLNLCPEEDVPKIPVPRILLNPWDKQLKCDFSHYISTINNSSFLNYCSTYSWVRMGQTSFIASYWEMLPVRAVLTLPLKTQDLLWGQISKPESYILQIFFFFIHSRGREPFTSVPN